jgi:glutamate dehydrogenase (NADP+)
MGSCTQGNRTGSKSSDHFGPDGYVYDPEGISGKKIDYLLELRASNQDIVKPYSYVFEGVEFHEGKRPWEVKVDIALPCATQNELSGEDARTLISNGVMMVAEISNMGCTPEAVEEFQKNNILFAPGKAVNAEECNIGT